MEYFLGLLAVLIIGIVLGYLLATHIHKIADAAAARAVRTIGTLTGEAVTLSPAPAPIVPISKL